MQKSVVSDHDFIDGAFYLLRGFRLLFQPGVKRYVVMPLLINIVFFIGLLWLNIHWFHVLLQWLDGLLPHWLHWLGSILWVIFALLLIILFSYTFSFVANIVAAPFNGFLAEKIQAICSDTPVPALGGWMDIAKEAPRLLKRQFKLIFYYLPKAILCLVLFFIPIVHLVAGFIWFLFNAWMMALQYADYPMDNNRVIFVDMRYLLAQKRGLNLGFGGAVMLATMIPVINFIVIPAAVAGATLLYVERY